MPKANTDLIRRVYEGLNRGEEALDLVDELTEPDFEFRAVLNLPDVDRFRGREATKTFLRQLFAAFDWHVEPEEFIDTGEAVLVIARGTSRGKTSGTELTNRIVHVWGIRRGKVSYFDAYRTKEEALEAAGIPE